MKVGDIVIAVQGKKRLLGWGEVRGDYRTTRMLHGILLTAERSSGGLVSAQSQFPNTGVVSRPSG